MSSSVKLRKDLFYRAEYLIISISGTRKRDKRTLRVDCGGYYTI